MHLIRKRKANTSMMDDIFDQIFLREKMFCPKLGACTGRWSSDTSDNEWKYKIDLKNMPTKPEDLKVKMDSKANILSVSGKSNVVKNLKNGLEIKSTHNWSQSVTIPENVDPKSISSKIQEGMLVFRGNFKEDETKTEHEIPIQIE